MQGIIEYRYSSGSSCTKEYAPNVFDLCNDVWCDRDAVCNSGCCVGDYCSSSLCWSDKQLTNIAFGAVLILLLILCCWLSYRAKKMREIKVRDAQIKYKKQSGMLSHDCEDEDDKAEKFRTVPLS